MNDTEYRISGNDVLTRIHDRFMGSHGQSINGPENLSYKKEKAVGNDWLKIGVIIVRIPVYTDGIINIFYVNMIGDDENTYIFKQIPHDEARFGKIIFAAKNRERIEQFDNTKIIECKARFGQKSRMRLDTTKSMQETLEWYSGKPVYKNGERIGGYDEDILEKQKKTAFLSKADRLKMEAKLREEKKQFLLNRANIERKQAARAEKEIIPAKVPTISTAQPTAKKKIALVPYIQMYPQNIGRLSVESEKKYILTDDRQLVEIS